MKLVIAPMEGVVDFVMRDLLTQIGGVDWCLTEFVRVTDRLLPKAEFYKYCPELLNGARTRSGVPIYIQLLGGQAGPLAENAKLAVDLGSPGIDLNFGCPAKTVNRHDGGASLLRTPQRLFEIVSAVRAAVPSALPVSAKVRLGFDHKRDFLEIARACEDAGASWLTVHARTKTDGYKPPAFWEYIGEIRGALKIPVIANGEIWSRDDFARCREVTDCDWFMIGRGLVARPDLALQIRGAGTALTAAALLEWVHWFFVASGEFRTPNYAIHRTKQWTKLLARNSPSMGLLFEAIKRCEHFTEMQAVLDTWTDTNEGEPDGQSCDLHQRRLPLLRGREDFTQEQKCLI